MFNDQYLLDPMFDYILDILTFSRFGTSSKSTNKNYKFKESDSFVLKNIPEYFLSYLTRNQHILDFSISSETDIKKALNMFIESFPSSNSIRKLTEIFIRKHFIMEFDLNDITLISLFEKFIFPVMNDILSKDKNSYEIIEDKNIIQNLIPEFRKKYPYITQSHTSKIEKLCKKNNLIPKNINPYPAYNRDYMDYTFKVKLSSKKFLEFIENTELTLDDNVGFVFISKDPIFLKRYLKYVVRFPLQITIMEDVETDGYDPDVILTTKEDADIYLEYYIGYYDNNKTPSITKDDVYLGKKIKFKSKKLVSEINDMLYECLSSIDYNYL